MRTPLTFVAVSASALLLSSIANAQTKFAKTTIDLLVPNEIKSTGAHGTVVLEGEISPEGTVANLHVTKSSRSEMIDQFVLTRYARAPIGKDLREGGADGIQLTVGVYNTRGLDFGARYTCKQAVLDSDWYKENFKTVENEHTPLYLLLQAGGGIFGNKQLAFAKNAKIYDRAWSDAIASCRNAPEAVWLDTLIKAGRDKQ